GRRRRPLRRLHPARDGPPERRPVHRPPLPPEARAGGQEGEEAEGGVSPSLIGKARHTHALSLPPWPGLSGPSRLGRRGSRWITRTSRVMTAIEEPSASRRSRPDRRRLSPRRSPAWSRGRACRTLP